MKLENRCLVPADRATTWGLVMDVPMAASCVPGIDQVSAQEDGKFEAVMRVRVGPISLNLSGTIQLVDRNADKGEASFVVEASDRRVGGAVKSNVAIRLEDQPDGQTELLIDSDTTFMGRLGELGQPIIRRKANTTLEEFARNLAQRIANPNP